MRKRKKMKGQYFLLGAIILISIIFTMVPISQPLISQRSEDLVRFSDNIHREFPKALNFGLNDTDSLNDLINFTGFSDNIARELFIDFTSLWVVAQGDPATQEVNVTVGNYLDTSTTVNLNISGTEENLFVAFDSTGSVTFSSIGAEYNMTISYEDFVKTVNWPRDKTNMYMMTNISRGKDLIATETVS